jgi:hypothetical protein
MTACVIYMVSSLYITVVLQLNYCASFILVLGEYDRVVPSRAAA